MPGLSWMQPRDPAVAARTVAWLCGAAVVVTVALAPLSPHGLLVSPHALVLSLVALGTTMAACLLSRFLSHDDTLGWAVCPVLAVVAVVLVDLVTGDASVAAQIFLLFPVLYGASSLPRAGAVVMAAVAVVAEVLVVGFRLPVREALVDAGYVTTALVTTTVLLVRAGERQAALVARLEEQAAIDPLTGLVTRRMLDQAAATALSCAGAAQGTSLVLLDLDRFKRVNDDLGHPTGDEVLVQLAAILRRRARPDDVVCRMGGDEIALLLPDCSLEVARDRAEQVVLDVREHVFLVPDVPPIRATVSAGVAHAPCHTFDLRGLYAAADGALYAAKRGGRDRLAVADPVAVAAA